MSLAAREVRLDDPDIWARRRRGALRGGPFPVRQPAEIGRPLLHETFEQNLDASALHAVALHQQADQRVRNQLGKRKFCDFLVHNTLKSLSSLPVSLLKSCNIAFVGFAIKSTAILWLPVVYSDSLSHRYH